MLSRRRSSKPGEQEEGTLKCLNDDFPSSQAKNSHVVRDRRMDVLTSFADIHCNAAPTLKQVNNV